MAQYIGNTPSSTLLQVRRQTYTFTATSNQTVFSGTDGYSNVLATPNAAQVLIYIDGVLLEPHQYSVGLDFVTLNSGVTAGSEVVIFTELEAALINTYTIAESQAAISSAVNNIDLDQITNVDLSTITQQIGQTIIWDGSNFIPGDLFSQDDFNSAFASKYTTDLAEGSNLYYTDARVGEYLTSNSYATETFVSTSISTAVSNLIDTAPATLDTLNEIAAALGDDPNFATTITASIGTKLATADFTSTANTWLATKTSSDLTEGTNLYYTDARAQAAISTDATLSYSNGVVSMPLSGVTAGSYGSASTVPVITVDAQGRITSASTTNVAGVSGFSYTPSTNTYTITTSAGTSFDATGDLTSFDTGDLTEGTNLYYTDARVGTYIGTITTNALTEGTTNLYYTDVRVSDYLANNGYDSAIAAKLNTADFTSTANTWLITKNTNSLSEGSNNLYYTDTRVGDYLTNNGYDTAANIVASIVDTAPTTLDTLNELAAALGDDPNFATTVTNAIGLKANTADLGTAAAENVEYFATAAQGALADSALQSVAFADLTSTPTTLAGYGITDAPAVLTDLGIVDGTIGQILTTDGAGGFTFEDAAVPLVVSGTAPSSPEEGALWFDNVATGQLYAYVGTSWLSTAGLTTLNFSSVGDLSDVDITTSTPTAGQALIWDAVNSKFIPGESFSQSDFNTAFAANSTDDLSEGVTNLYYTDDRADARIALASSNYATAAQGALADTALQSVAFADLTSTPTTLAGYGITDAATSAQGALADTALQAADLTGYATETYVGTAISNLIDTAPTTLDTLNELAAALGDDPNFATSVTNSIGLKANTADLGTAAYEDVGYFATAAQGALADTALQSVAFADLTSTPTTLAGYGITDAPASLTDLGIVDGTIGQILTTDGAGGFTFEDAAEPLVVSGTAPASPEEGALWFDNVTTGQLYAYVGTSWLSTAGLTTLNFSSVGDLSDVDITSVAPTDGQALVWDSASSTFIPGDVAVDFTGYATETYVNTAISTASSNYATAAQGALADTALQSVAFADLTSTPTTIAGYGITDAFDGAYSSLSGTPTLGTASAEDSTAFATAAQGALADTALQASDLTGYATETYVGTAISSLIDSAPGALDTLNELAAALGNDENFSTTITNAIALKANSADLGTAAAQNVEYFATAAQGALADTALQSVEFSDLGIVDGTIGQVLVTDGAGTYTFEDAASPVVVSGTAPSSPVEGDMWFDNVTTGQLYTYVGTSWLSTAGLTTLNFSSVGDLSDVDITSVAPTDGQALVWDNANSKFIPADVAVDFTGYATETFVNNAVAAKDNTDEITEGTTNLYYTDARVETKIDAYVTGGTGVTVTSGEIAIGQDVSTTANVTFADITSTGSVQIDGDLTVSGTTVTINATNLAVEDNMIYLNEGSAVANPDLGIAGNYNDGTYAHAGVFRDATDGVWKFYDGYTPEPDASAYIDTTHASFNLASVQASSFIGNITGTVSSLSNHTTTDLSEGTNLYYTDARVGTYLTTNSYATETFVGSAITTASSNYATAAQGALADTALQSVAFSDLTSTPTTLSGYGITDAPSILTDLSITDGTIGQVLTTDGAGGFTFEDAAAGGATVSGTAPASPSEGDLWFDNTNSGQLYTYVGTTWLSTAGLSTLEFSSVGDLSDVDLATNAPTDGQALVWDSASSTFIPGDVAVDFTGYATETYVTSAISTASSNYATAAQGALADSALQSADLTGYATETYVNTAVSDLVASAPAALDTLNELAAALGNDENFAATITNSIALKANSADLGTAAAQNVEYFATAAQGALADSALQSVAFGDLTSTPTTLAGYGITDAFDGAYSSLSGTPTIPSALTDLGITDGTIGQVLTTDGAGGFTFADAGGASVVVSGTAPETAEEGDLWFDNVTTGELHVYENGAWLSTAVPVTIESINELGDVDITTTAPTDGQALIWDAINSKFVPGDSFSQSDFNNALGTISADIIPATDVTYDLGSATNRFKDLYLSGNSIYLGEGLVLSNDGGTFVISDGASTPLPVSLSNNTTSDLAEGTNLYYTDERVGTYLTTNSYATETFVNTAVSDLVASAPAALDTLNELAAALGNDENFATTITNSIALKANIADIPSALTDLGITDGTIGQILTTDGSGSFTFTDAASGVTVSGTAPSSPSDGDLWFDDTTSGQLYVYENGSWTSTGIPPSIGSIDELSDVDITTTAPTDGQALVWDNANSKFVPGDVAVDLTGYATETYVNTSISTASSNYATAAQGALADTALQSVAFSDLGIADGTIGQVLTTDGAGNYSFADTAVAYGDSDVATYLSTNGFDTAANIVASIVDTAPTTLDTLNELAAALGDDPNFATTTAAAIGLKANSADLGTAAAQNVEYFATAAQGALADTALQSVAFADLTSTPTTLAGYGITDTIPSVLTDLSIVDGTIGQVLTTDGAGGFTFEDAAIGGAVVSGTAPVAPEEGALWFDNTNSGQLYTYVGTTWLSTAGLSTLEFSSVGDLSDVDLVSNAPTDGQALIWDNVNSKFVPGDVAVDLTGYATETFVGTAISTASSNYATAAQGELADSALQSVAFSDLGIADGTVGQVLTTDGAGNYSFADTAVAYGDSDVATYLSSNGFDTASNIVASIVDTAPTTLDTLNELAAALGDDPNFATTTANAIGLKANTADLGTAAAEDVGYFATAAQGALADTALQSVAFADLTSTPTTLAGYGITDAPASLTDLGIVDGTVGQVLITDGAGGFTFADASGGGGASITTSETAPVSPSEGDMWFNSATLALYLYYNDGDSTQWIQVNDAGGAAGNGLVIVSSTPPVNPAIGDLWYDDASTGSLLIYNGSVWVSTADGGGGGSDQSTYWVETSTTYDAVAGSKLFVDTSSNAVQVNLPASPIMGDEVYIVDAAGNSGAYNITVNRNGNKITGLDENLTIDVDGAAIILAYYNVTRGWIVISK